MMKGILVSLCGVFFIFVAVALLFPAYSGPTNAPRLRAKQSTTVLAAMLKQYRVEYDRYPEGDHAAILRALRGDNPQHIIFIEDQDQKLDRQGLWLDPWGSLYRVDVSTADAPPRVWSPGKDKLDDPDNSLSDDVVSWR
jgi:hypothetical protein